MSSNATVAALANPSPNEPSMEEILASIRRIIADDTLGTKPDEPLPALPAEIAVTLEDLATPVEVDFNVEDPDADVLDLAKVASVAAKPVKVDLRIENAAFDRDADLLEPKAAPTMITSPSVLAPVATVAQPQINSVPMLENHILSQETGSLIGQAFQSLQRNVNVVPARSLEDLITEMLRPMLRGWLDEHLPGIVERLVKAEIERVARGG